jgi:hypothetical protein
MTRLVNLGVAVKVFDQRNVRQCTLMRSELARARGQSQCLPVLTSAVQSMEVSYAFKSVQEYDL